jgi:DNA invertase Pin-like site-specific DNA recombinase
MSHVFVYLRVSTNQQDVDNQKHGVIAYCDKEKLLAPSFVEDTVSGKVSWRDRPLGALIANASAGDTIIVSEISRLARSLLQILEIMKECAEKGIHLHSVKNGFKFDGTLQAKIMATVLGLAAEIERDLISSRTKESLAKKKAEGVVLGRRPGPNKKLRLDEHAKAIDNYLAHELNKRAIAKLVGCAPNTLNFWLSVRRPEIAKSAEPAIKI